MCTVRGMGYFNKDHQNASAVLKSGLGIAYPLCTLFRSCWESAVSVGSLLYPFAPFYPVPGRKDRIMEKKNVVTAVTSGSFVITDRTPLGELLGVLHLTSTSRKPCKTPTYKKLRETAGDPIAVCMGCEVFCNGWAVYRNKTGRTVVWLPSCANFTYYFNELKNCEKEYLNQTAEIKEEQLMSKSWVLALTLVGDHRVEKNNMNWTGSRIGTRVYESVDEEGNENGDIEEIAYSMGGRENDRALGANPLDVFAEKESFEHLMRCLTEKQKEVVVLYYRDGYTQQEIGNILGISRDSVADRLESALKRIKKNF